MQYFPSVLNSIDLFTKPLLEAQFCKLRDSIGLVKLPSRGSVNCTHVCDDNFILRRLFCCIVLIIMYTFMVSSLCMKNYSTFILSSTFVVSSLYVRNYFLCTLCIPSWLVCFMWKTILHNFCTPSWLVFSTWETSGTIWSTISVIYMWGISMCFLALFDYPYMRNSYMLMLCFVLWSTYIFFIYNRWL